MKKILVISAILMLAVAPAFAITYTDDFTTNSGNWNFGSHDITISGGYLNVNADLSPGGAVFAYGAQDFTLEYDIKVTSMPYGSGWYGLPEWRAADAGVEDANGYQAELIGAGNTIIRSDVSGTIGGVGGSSWDVNGGWNHVKLICAGQSQKMWINDVVHMDAVNAYLGGGTQIGLGTRHLGLAYDNFSLTIAEVPEPGTIVALLSGLSGLALIRRKRA